MKFRDVMNLTPMPEKEKLCRDVGISMKYLRKLTGGYCVPSLQVANEIIKRYPEITMQDFVDANTDYQNRTRH